MAKMIRIGFHDCVGGCDGCLNVDNDSNAGLSGIVATLEDLYTDEVLSLFLIINMMLEFRKVTEV